MARRKKGDFAGYVTKFLTNYLTDWGASENTRASYRDTLLLLIRDFFGDFKRIQIDKLSLSDLNKTNTLEFLDWLEKVRECKPSTRNNKLAAIRAFMKFLQFEAVELVGESQQILSIRTKRYVSEIPNWLSLDSLKLLFEQPDLSTIRGRKDLALMSLLYDSGARVQEIIDLTPSKFRIDIPAVELLGKGNKKRLINLMPDQIAVLKNYMKEHQLDQAHKSLEPLFQNYQGGKYTRNAINSIVKKYFAKAKKVDPSKFPEKFSCHGFRHSKAIHMLQAGVELLYIQRFLGHKSIVTTERYARVVDTSKMRQALEKAYINMNPNEQPRWKSDSGLVNWLRAL